MTNTQAATGSIVKTAATYVGFAAAPFAIALAVSSVFTPPVERRVASSPRASSPMFAGQVWKPDVVAIHLPTEQSPRRKVGFFIVLLTPSNGG